MQYAEAPLTEEKQFSNVWTKAVWRGEVLLAGY